MRSTRGKPSTNSSGTASVATSASGSATVPRKTGFLVSKRYDVSKFDVPEYHWPFYDAYHDSKQCKAAVAQHTNSIQGGNLERFLTMTKSFSQVPVTVDQLVAHLSPPFNKLLACQKENGIFTNLPRVLQILSLPKWLREEMPRAESDDVMATALAVAAMRQRVDLFNELRDAHDVAVRHIHNGLIIEALDLITEYSLSSTEFEIEYEQEMRNQNTAKPFTAPVLKNQSSCNVSSVSEPVSTTRTTQVDLLKAETVRVEIERKGGDLTLLLLELDVRVEDANTCLHRCVSKFLGTEMLTEKNAAFDELTCRLGDGAAAREGFQDWRRAGVPGVRTLIVDILNKLQALAELKLDFEELRSPPPALSVRHLDKSLYFSHGNRGRWAFHYNGIDAVHKILHW
jgi:hypothetical protein